MQIKSRAEDFMAHQKLINIYNDLIRTLAEADFLTEMVQTIKPLYFPFSFLQKQYTP